MARTVPDFEFRGRGRPLKYPWETWEDGQKRILKQGQDFQCSISTLRNQIYNRAKVRGMKALTNQISDTELAIQFATQ